MSEYYEQDSPQTLEQVFHLLSTRVFNIQNGNIDKGYSILLDEKYDEKYCKSIIKPILLGIFSFPTSTSLKEVNHFLSKIEKLNASKTAIIDKIDFKSRIIALSANELKKFKKEAAKGISDELDFYSMQLLTLKNDLNEKLKEGDSEILESRPIDLPNGVKLPKPTGKVITALSVAQAALLFYLLKDRGAILDFSNKSLAILINQLTGHSSQNLRAQHLANISKILEGKANKVNGKNHDLIAVKDLLQGLVEKIDSQMQTNNARKK